MSKVSFEGIGEVRATFYAQENTKAGQVVKLNGDSEVGPCAAGERFFGVAASVQDGYAGVKVHGFTEVDCADSTVAVGYVKLTADGKGGVKKVGSSDAGEEYLVTAKSAGDTITIKM